MCENNLCLLLIFLDGRKKDGSLGAIFFFIVFSVFSQSALYTRVRCESSIDREHDTCDRACRLVVTQEEHTAKQLLAVNKASCRRAAQDLVRARCRRAVLVEQQAAVLVRHQEAGRDRVAADARACKVCREPLRKV